jgi:hypothetical protein
MVQHNANRHGLHDRLRVLCHDGLPPPDALPGTCGPAGLDLALVNPPTHATPESLQSMFGSLVPWMARDAQAYVVVARPGRARQALEGAGAHVELETRHGGYWILGARWSGAGSGVS